MVRDLQAKIGVTAADTERQNEWARIFHEMEHPEPAETPAAKPKK
jgi:hypothetical protein